MDGLFTLLSLSLVMAIASFLAGSLPLSFSLSPAQLRLISTIGMGVLVGTSLIVIIPEGVETLYSANKSDSGHKRRALVERNLPERWQAPVNEIIWRRSAEDTNPFQALPGPVVPNDLMRTDAPVIDGKIAPQSANAKEGTKAGSGGDRDQVPSQEGKSHDHANESTHVWIGFSLISGFIMMYLIDRLPRIAASKPQPLPYHISLDNLGRGPHRASSASRDSEHDSFLGSNSTSRQNTENRSFATTTGLIIHAAADGIALGASSTTPDKSLSFIIFLAIMVHKAPAAFGLTSVLLKQGLSKRAARGHLLGFSLAAPVGAISTWIFAHLLGKGFGSQEGTRWWTGILLLFSGGTFLYVAMHTMQEESSTNDHQHREPLANGYVEGRDAPRDQKPELRDIGAAVFGMVLPLFLQFGHAH